MPQNTDEALRLRREVMERDFSRMNPRQREAVFHTEGPLLILAGAGSGKTTVLINRIANLVRYGKAYESRDFEENLNDGDIQNCREFLAGGEIRDETRSRLSVSAAKPWQILAITFTNKAASELKDRIEAMLGPGGREVWAATFHSSCARILRRYGDRLGFTPHFTIYDTDDSQRLMKSVMEDLGISERALSPKSVLKEISRAKDSLLSPKEYSKEVENDYRLRQISRAYDEYEDRLKSADAMDFDDLLMNTVRLFRENRDVLEYFQKRFRYIMVDEYQDTNRAQYEFVSLLAKESGNICVVGDDDQSIYRFRGATIENILNFEQDFPGAKVIRLEQNYRSTQNILSAANAVISNNTQRKGKTLWTAAGAGKKLHLHEAGDETKEAEKAAEVIADGVKDGKKYSDFAVLYRMNAQSLSFERTFTRRGIPHRIIGGTRFFDRAEIKDMIAYLSVITNPEDEVRLARIVNVPQRGIGARTMENARSIARGLGEPLLWVFSHAEEFPAISRAAQRLKDFAELITSLSRENEAGESPSRLYAQVLERTEYPNYLLSNDPEKAVERMQNVGELASMISRYEEEAGEGGDLSGFLEDVALFADIDNYDAGADSVVLMTMHSAKGLEFPNVFLPGWEEGVFPGNAILFDPGEVEEERRLAYVALTRAKEEIWILHARMRTVFGSTTRNQLSRFAREIPRELIEESSDVKRNVINFPGDPFSGLGMRTDAPAPVRQEADPGDFSVGDTVLHKTFGQGVVLNRSPMGNDTLLEIAFERVGTKKILANYAKLIKIE